MNTTPGEGEIKRKRLEFSISSEGSGDTVDSRGYYSEDSSADLLKMHRTPSCVSSITQCANQQKLDDLYRSYSKLKIYFCVLCVVNVIIILLVCVFFAVFFIRFSKNDQGFDNLFQKPPQVDDKPVQSKSQALSSNDHTLIRLPQLHKETEAKIKCSVLRYKLNVTQYEQKEMCSLEDMVDSISKFLRPREYNGKCSINAEKANFSTAWLFYYDIITSTLYVYLFSFVWFCLVVGHNAITDIWSFSTFVLIVDVLHLTDGSPEKGIAFVSSREASKIVAYISK